MKQRHEVLFNQLEAYRSDILSVLENVTGEEAEVIPKGFNNNIRWNMGHIFLDQYLWIEALTKEKGDVSEQFNSWFGFGTSPGNFNIETPSFEQLKTLLKLQPTNIKEKYGSRLEEIFPPTEMGMQTIEQVLIRTIFHEGMHLQAIVDIKKCI
ncbi:DinB family protein [Cytobacillus horneckiae]|uniref:DinB family protein n=1 Tax=Cytobacillus horneckiae TaxID=549687 RepID=A0A2N0ZAA5_9BACI|nr:DinB family protein [Cytobacillus horneckiae]NRG46771.1 DinB family protein [Bacillus sp. CRN 9]MBN6886375.1 DinB family protein [Cytobacillus horneckiae]MEC1158545.1 DinB family protein [Cytobacillus horneckiae]MED2939648.1 DinB family protein [Cytobacillus horneckiae]PKG26444.1 DinB family protein [Cytobacillus horneckiae]